MRASKADWERVCAYQMAKYEKTDKTHRYYLENALNDVVAGLVHTGQFDRAVTMMTDALDVCPQLYPRLAEMLLRHDRREEAAAICRKGIAKDDHMIPTYELRDLLRKMRPLVERLGCSDEWLRLLNDLRTEGKMRRNLVAILNEIDREQGGSGRIADMK